MSEEVSGLLSGSSLAQEPVQQPSKLISLEIKGLEVSWG